MAEKLVVLDLSSLLHRAYHALPALTTADGQPTNAVYGLAQMLLLLIEQESPDLMAAAMDPPGPTFRHERYPQYKESRPPAPEDLAAQFAPARELLEAFGIKAVECAGYEADDVMGALARQARDRGIETLLVTGDRDALQLVGEGVSVLRTMRGVTDTVRYDAAKVEEDFQLKPDQLVDAKGLAGDSSDDIPGIPGIGPKTALALLEQFGTLEAVLERAEEIESARVRRKVEEFGDQAVLSKELGTIRSDMPLEGDLEGLRLAPLEAERLRPLFGRLEFASLLARLPGASVSAESLAYETVTGAEDVRERCDAARGQTAGLAVAVEGDKPHRATLQGVAVAPGEGEAWFVPASLVAETRREEGTADLFGAAEEAGLPFDPQAAEALQELLSDPQTTLVTPGIKVGHAVLARHGLAPHGGRDPLLAAYLLDPDRGDRQLSDVVLERAGLQLEPPEAGAAHEACAAADGALRVWPGLERDLRNLELWALFETVESPLASILAEMESAGIALDRERLQSVGGEMEGRLDRLRSEVLELVGEEFNLDSPKQLGQVLFEKLKLPAGRRTKTGYSTSAQVLAGLVEKHPVIPLILEYREFFKLKSTYVDGLRREADPTTGRVHTSFEQHVAATGRLSSREPNLQNIPIRSEWGREIRACFVPGGPGQRLVAADYSQIELRLLAHFSQDEGLLAAFGAGEDIHRRTACRLFEVEPDDVTPDMRRQAKTVNFAVIYGMGPTALGQELDISRDEAQRFIDNYFRQLPGVRRYIDETLERATQDGYVTTILGRRRVIAGLQSGDEGARSYAQRAAVNAPIQGSAADIIKLAMIRLRPRLTEELPHTRALLQVHDELVFEAAEEETATLARVAREVMETAEELSVPLVVEVKAGPNWKDMAPVA